MSKPTKPAAPDLEQANRFLRVLAGDEAHTFQTFSDTKGNSRGLVRCLHGHLAEHADTLTRLNQGGAGVFVTVNQTDLKGRKVANIARVRAVFIDIDTPGPAPSLELRPHLLVESSPGKWHAYWVVSDCSLDQFKLIQSALSSRYSSDPAVKDLPRVMRLPGFHHLKAKPFLTRIADELPERPYSTSEVVQRLGLSGYLVEKPVAKPPKLPKRVQAVKRTAPLSNARSQVHGGGAVVVVDRHQDALRLIGALARYGLPEELIRYVVEEEIMRGRWSREMGGDEIDRMVKGAMSKFSPHGECPEPQPLPSRLPPVGSLTPELLPDNFRAWLVDIAERLNVPLDFPAAAALTIASIAVGRRASICPQKAGDWVVVPNLWGALVGRPGSKKSPTLGAAMAPMNKIIGKCKAEHAAAVAKHESGMATVDLEIDELKAKIKKLARSDEEGSLKEMEGLKLRLQELSKTQDPPTERRFKSNDPTIEALAVLLAANPDGILVERDELMGWLSSMERQGREQDRPFYLECWNGNAAYFEYDRIGRGHLTVKSPCVSVLGGIQPDRLRRYVAGALHGDGDGLLQRFQLAVWPDLPPLQQVDRAPNEAAFKVALAAFERLLSLDPKVIEAAGGFASPDVQGSPCLRFNDEAQARFSEWKLDLDRRVRTEPMPEILASHLDKFGSLVASLALVFHLCDSENLDLRVPLHQLDRALGWADVLETHARRIYADASAPGVSASHAIVERFVAGNLPLGGVTCRSIQRHGWPDLKDVPTVEAGLDLLAKHGWLIAHPREPSEKGGRPTVDYVLNPKAWQEGPDGGVLPRLGFGSSAGGSLDAESEAA